MTRGKCGGFIYTVFVSLRVFYRWEVTKRMAAKRYYWLKLKEDFFADDGAISWIEEQENGKEYCLFYLKLCLKALKSEGILIRTVGDILVPYDVGKLAEITRTSVDTVRIAMQLFQQIGLVQVLENGEIYLTQLSQMVGSETDKAALMRKSRESKKLGNNVTPALPNCYTEKEKEIEIDKEKDKEQFSGMVAAIVSHLNLKTGSQYKTSGKKMQSLIRARINEGFTVDDFKRVIDIKAAEWGGDEKMDRYLRPDTLFSPKFESYLNQKPKRSTQHQSNAAPDELDGIL